MSGRCGRRTGRRPGPGRQASARAGTSTEGRWRAPGGTWRRHGRSTPPVRTTGSSPVPPYGRLGRCPPYGILAGPIDLDGPRRPRTTHPVVEAVPGLVATQRGTPFTGRVHRGPAATGWCSVNPADWARHPHLPPRPRAFDVEGRTVTLVPPGPHRPSAPPRTASGSVAVPGASARIARASRILVEGVHDAELVEKVWGDDLRVEGVVVELLDGADNLRRSSGPSGPGPGRRLGILLDHLVTGSKESAWPPRLDHPDVLVTGHPYVDVWQAVKPRSPGIDAGPTSRRARRKEGVLAALGVEDHAGPVLEAPPRSGDELDRPRAAADRRRRAPHRLRDRAGPRLIPACYGRPPAGAPDHLRRPSGDRSAGAGPRTVEVRRALGPDRRERAGDQVARDVAVDAPAGFDHVVWPAQSRVSSRDRGAVVHHEGTVVGR